MELKSTSRMASPSGLGGLLKVSSSCWVRGGGGKGERPGLGSGVIMGGMLRTAPLSFKATVNSFRSFSMHF